MKKRSTSLLLAGALLILGLHAAPMPVYADSIQIETGTDIASEETFEDEEVLQAWYLSDGETTDEQISREDMEAYIADGSFEDRLAFMEEKQEQQEQNLKSLLGNLEKYLPREDGSDEEDVQAGLEREKVTGITPIMPAEGNVKTMVVFCEFKDQAFTQSFKDDLKNAMFKETDTSDDNYPRESLRAYYNRSSYGKLNITGDFYDFKSEHERSWYETADKSNDKLCKEMFENIRNQILAGKPTDSEMTDQEYVNNALSAYDLDGDRNIDCCYIVIPGGNTGWGSQWWCYRTQPNLEIKGSDYNLPTYIVMVDSNSDAGVTGKDDVKNYMETFIHETGHQLGLVDYYSYGDDDVNKIKTFAMMNNNEGDQDGFAKMLLGWIPYKNVQFATTGSQTYTLKSYANNGELLIILPEKAKDATGLYSQFILAEYYVKEGNDISAEDIKDKDGKVTYANPGYGLRLYRIYGLLNSDETEFLASNESDDKLPLIECINKEDTFGGFFEEGDTITPKTDPSTFFYKDNGDAANISECSFEDSGISIDNIVRNTEGENTTMSVNVTFAEASEAGPKVKEVKFNNNETYGYYITVKFDRPVNYIGDKDKIEVFDYNEEKKETGVSWGELDAVRNNLIPAIYPSRTDTLYFMLIEKNVRFTKGLLVLPPNTVTASDGTVAGKLNIPFDAAEDKTVSITASVESGTYADPFKVEIATSTLPEGAVIRYDINNNVPDSDSAVYEDPIDIEKSCNLNAYVFDSKGNVISNLLYNSYVIEKLEFVRKEVTIDVGEYYYLLRSLTTDFDSSESYESLDTSIVTVTDTGRIYGVKEGTATVKAKTQYASDTIKVTVKKGVSDGFKAMLKESLKDNYLKEAGTKTKEIIEDITGRWTLQELAEKGTDHIWVADIPAQSYNGTALKPDVTVYKGVDTLKLKTDYTVSYKKNKNAGTANVTVKLKKNYGGGKIETTFNINPANLASQYSLPDCGVIANKRDQKPVPTLIRTDNGQVQKLNKKDFIISYQNENGEDINSVKEPGTYAVVVESNSDNFIGNLKANIYVQDKNILEKLKVKKITNSFKYSDYNGKEIMPQYGTDFTFTTPKGYDEITIDKTTKLPSGFKFEYFNTRTEKGKVTVLVTAKGGNDNYGGRLLLTFTVK